MPDETLDDLSPEELEERRLEGLAMPMVQRWREMSHKAFDEYRRKRQDTERLTVAQLISRLKKMPKSALVNVETGCCYESARSAGLSISGDEVTISSELEDD